MTTQLQPPVPDPPPTHTPQGLPGNTDLVVFIAPDGTQHGPMPAREWADYATQAGLGPTPVTNVIDGVESALIEDAQALARAHPWHRPVPPPTTDPGGPVVPLPPSQPVKPGNVLGR